VSSSDTELRSGNLIDRLAAIAMDADHAVFVAEGEDGRIFGWLHVFGSKLLVSSPSAELGGLVVDARSRGAGVGQALMRVAENWASEKGYDRLRVRSNIVRADAHRFYNAI
jgi:GNAT superfamily N-acetyltransferase